MKKTGSGAFAGLLAALVLAAPAAAAPANVTVRVEGEAHTLVPRTAVTTSITPVGKDGINTCSGTSALGALDRAVGGDWAAWPECASGGQRGQLRWVPGDRGEPSVG